jgi:hypothetical protein
VDEEPSVWSGHVIMCGLHDVGMRVLEQLHAAVERVIVVDDDPSVDRGRETGPAAGFVADGPAVLSVRSWRERP